MQELSDIDLLMEFFGLGDSYWETELLNEESILDLSSYLKRDQDYNVN